MKNHCECNWSGWPWFNGNDCGCGCATANQCTCDKCNCANRTRGFCAFTLSGTVTNTAGDPVDGISIHYEVGGVTYRTTTNSAGMYSVAVPNCTSVTITLAPIVGVTVSPEYYVLTNISCDVAQLDFTLTPLPVSYSISGTVSGHANNVGIPVYYTINGVPGSTTTGAGGVYSFVVQAGANVTVTPSLQSGYTVAPPSYAISSVSSNVTTGNFAYTPISTYQISGTLSTALGGIGSATVDYTVDGTMYETVTDIDGGYVIYAPRGTDVVITPPDIDDYDVTPASITLNNVGGNMTGQDFFYEPF